MRKKRILILSCSHGSGHKMVSEALDSEFRNVDCSVKICDLFNETNTIINRVIEKSYLLSYTIGSAFYKKIYYDMEKDAHSPFIYQLWSVTRRTLLKVIDDFKPDCIINTYPYTISSILKKNYYPDMPIYTVVTDFCIPAAWHHEDTSKYYVACENVENHLRDFGVLPSQILKTGIPLRPGFYEDFNRQALYKKYGLSPDKTTLVICAGTYGVLKDLDHICQRVSKLDNLQTVVICGKNKALYKKLQAQSYENTHILGYTRTIHELYRLGDFMVTKPGGITLSEAVITEMPVILFRPVPGQEGENAEWFKACHAAIIANTTAELTLAVESLASNEIKRFSMKSALRKMNYGKASHVIASDILKELDMQQSHLPEHTQFNIFNEI